ncbi:hypothetical protein EB796_005015 [Bugula neritina]|uniref:Uncharacterized protein n=1 Tax=Bugula neritina TaxID=10212 RepID=A0A7J7KDD3_BUGNE|nr:hypothetical protein EB796_005015 [Bugula neritina]
MDLERRMAETLGYHTLDEKSVTHDTLTSETGALTDNIDGLTSFIDALPNNTEAPINNTEVETETSNEEGDSSRNTSETESCISQLKVWKSLLNLNFTKVQTLLYSAPTTIQ